MFAAKSSQSKIKPRQLRNVGIQPRLKIGEPNDKYEKEADRVADAVMRMPDSGGYMQPKRKKQTPPIQMKCKRCEESLQMNPAGSSNTNEKGSSTSQQANQLMASKGQGSSLPANVQREMSGKIGADFGNVNIHTGSKAIQMNQALGARAFTHGRDIYFNRGQYDPTSSGGKHLLAHELTHVVQQTNGELIQRQEENEETISKENDPCEYEDSNQTDREIHLNLGMRAIRVYERNGNSYRVGLEFRDVIVGPATRDLARAQSDSPSSWCHLYPIIGHQEYTSHGLINFVNYCGEFGFHSNYWRKMRNGERKIERIPGDESAGCARIIDPSDDIDDNSRAREFTESRSFYDSVQSRDCVRLYSHSSSWREPTFSTCRWDANCDVD